MTEALTIDPALSAARDSLNVNRVFGKPIVTSRLTVISAVRFGGGGGAGNGPAGEHGSKFAAMGRAAIAAFALSTARFVSLAIRRSLPSA